MQLVTYREEKERERGRGERERERERERSTFHFDAISVSEIEHIISHLSPYLVSLSISIDKYNIHPATTKVRSIKMHKLYHTKIS